MQALNANSSVTGPTTMSLKTCKIHIKSLSHALSSSAKCTSRRLPVDWEDIIPHLRQLPPAQSRASLIQRVPGQHAERPQEEQRRQQHWQQCRSCYALPTQAQ